MARVGTAAIEDHSAGAEPKMTVSTAREIRIGFEVEDRGWKGAGGTSTLREPGALAFFVEQAKLLSASGHLLLAYLDLDDTTIAFELRYAVDTSRIRCHALMGSQPSNSLK
jgi:hypothetical protein